MEAASSLHRWRTSAATSSTLTNRFVGWSASSTSVITFSCKQHTESEQDIESSKHLSDTVPGRVLRIHLTGATHLMAADLCTILHCSACLSQVSHAGFIPATWGVLSQGVFPPYGRAAVLGGMSQIRRAVHPALGMPRALAVSSS